MSTLLYLLTFERYGNREGHHYTGGLYSDLAAATIEGLRHEAFRAEKYEMRIEIIEIDKPYQTKEIPREVAINYAKLKFPEMFDDKSRLKEET